MSNNLNKCLCIKDDYIGYILNREYNFQSHGMSIYAIYLEDMSTFQWFTPAQFNKCFVDLTKQVNRNNSINEIINQT